MKKSEPIIAYTYDLRLLVRSIGFPSHVTHTNKPVCLGQSSLAMFHGSIATCIWEKRSASLASLLTLRLALKDMEGNWLRQPLRTWKSAVCCRPEVVHSRQVASTSFACLLRERLAGNIAVLDVKYSSRGQRSPEVLRIRMRESAF